MTQFTRFSARRHKNELCRNSTAQVGSEIYFVKRNSLQTPSHLPRRRIDL
jgi:hypothetical protein